MRKTGLLKASKEHELMTDGSKPDPNLTLMREPPITSAPTVAKKPPAVPRAKAKASKNLQQQIADTEARLAQLRAKSRAVETGQKVILGGLLIAEARKDARIRQWLLRAAREHVTRDVDLQRLEPLLAELDALGAPERSPIPRSSFSGSGDGR